MKKTLRIFLGDTHKMAMNWQALESATKALFAASVKKSKKFGEVVVKTVTSAPSLLPEDLLIYVVPSQPAGVLVNRFGPYKKTEETYGLTQWEGTLFGAQVYVRDLVSDPEYVAKFVWHEALHVKMREEQEMHQRGGLAGAIGYDTELTGKNVKDMLNCMGKQRTMWTGGFSQVQPSGDIDWDAPL